MPFGRAEISAQADRLPPLVLASSSPYRAQLLHRLGQPFTCHAPGIDESAQRGESPAALVRRLSEQKARTVAAAYSDALVIGGDQLAVLGNGVVGKPGSRSAAIEQLLAASGRQLQFLTGLSVVDCRSQRQRTVVVPTGVVFRQLQRTQILDYLDAEQPFDCAGSFKAEGLGICLFESLSSDDPTALPGLPLIALVTLLNGFGYRLPTGSPAQTEVVD